MLRSLAPVDTSDFIFPELNVARDPDVAGFYSDLLLGLNHKFNNILGIVQGNASLIELEPGLDEEIRSGLMEIREACADASKLCQQVVAAGASARTEMQIIDTNKAMTGMIEAVRDAVAETGIVMEIDVSPDLPEVNADLNRLTQIIVELAKNAAEAAKLNGGMARMHVQPSGQGVDFLVINTGGSLGDASQAFRPFTTMRGSPHYGIGLTYAAVVADQMNFRLGYRDEENEVAFLLRAPMVP